MRWALALIFGLLLGQPSYADDFTLLNVGTFTKETFQAPGDISPATAWYSCSRGYSHTDTSPACNVCTPLDATCADLPVIDELAILPPALIACNNTSNPCTVKIAYDKTGNGNNITNGTIANRPTLLVAGSPAAPNGCPLNSLMCVNVASGQSLCKSGFNGAVDLAQPFTFYAFQNTGTTLAIDGAQIWGGSGGGGPTQLFARDTAHPEEVGIYAGTNQYAFAYRGTWVNMIAAMNGASTSFRVAATATTTNAGAQAFFNTSACFGIDTFGDNWTGIATEWGTWPIAFSSTQIASLATNVQAFYNLYAFFDDGPFVPFLPNNAANNYNSATKVLSLYWYGWQPVAGTYAAVGRAADYNSVTNQWNGPYTVGTGGATAATADYHGAPTCAVSNAGYRFCGLGAHNSALQLFVTATPNDPSSFTSIGTYGTNVTGATFIHIASTDKLYLFSGAQGNGTNNQDAEFVSICTPLAATLTCGAAKNIFDVAASLSTGWQAGGSITTDGTYIYLVANYALLINGAWTASYAYRYDPVTGNVGTVTGSDIVTPASQPLGPVSYLNSTPGYLVGTATGAGFGQTNISVANGNLNVTAANYSTIGVLQYFQNSGLSWSTAQAVTTGINTLDALIGTVSCTRVNSSGQVEAYYTDNLDGISKSTLVGGIWHSQGQVLGQQAGNAVFVMQCPPSAPDMMSVVMAEMNDVTNSGNNRGYLFGSSGFIANPAGL